MELIAQIKESQEPIPLVQQFVQAMWEDKSGLHGAYRRLFNALRSKSLRHRGNIGFALCQLCKRMRSETDPHELYQQSQDVLLKDSTEVRISEPASELQPAFRTSVVPVYAVGRISADAASFPVG